MYKIILYTIIVVDILLIAAMYIEPEVLSCNSSAPSNELIIMDDEKKQSSWFPAVTEPEQHKGSNDIMYVPIFLMTR